MPMHHLTSLNRANQQVLHLSAITNTYMAHLANKLYYWILSTITEQKCQIKVNVGFLQQNKQ